MLEYESDCSRVQSGVECVEDRAKHWDAVVSFKERGHVWRHDGNGIAGPDSALCQSRRKAAASLIKVPVRQA